MSCESSGCGIHSGFSRGTHQPNGRWNRGVGRRSMDIDERNEMTDQPMDDETRTEPTPVRRQSRWERLRPHSRSGRILASIAAVVAALVVGGSIFTAGYAV